MLENKLKTSILAGAMALAGMVGGTAFIASANTTSANNQNPVMANSSVATTDAVDTPESASTVDTDSVQSGSQGSDIGEKADAPESSIETLNDPAGGPDNQNQVGDVSDGPDTAGQTGTNQ